MPILNSEYDVGKGLVFLVTLVVLDFQYQPGYVVVAENYFTELVEFYWIVRPHFGIQETYAIFTHDHKWRIPIPLRR